MKYSVLIKAVVDVRTDDIVAASQREAIERAREINLHSLIDKDGPVRSAERPIRYLPTEGCQAHLCTSVLAVSRGTINRVLTLAEYLVRLQDKQQSFPTNDRLHSVRPLLPPARHFCVLARLGLSLAAVCRAEANWRLCH